MYIKIQAGKYYVGDPCYALTDAQYKNFLIKKEEVNWPTVYEDENMLVFATHSGDGRYECMLNTSYFLPVDSGQLSLIKFEFIKKKQINYVVRYDCGVFYNFEIDFQAKLKDGNLTSAYVNIYTNDENE